MLCSTGCSAGCESPPELLVSLDSSLLLTRPFKGEGQSRIRQYFQEIALAAKQIGDCCGLALTIAKFMRSMTSILPICGIIHPFP